MAKDRLIVYKKDGCFKCEQVMNLLELKKIDFEKRVMEKCRDEVKDYPHFAKNLYPVMKYNDKFVTLREVISLFK